MTVRFTPFAEEQIEVLQAHYARRGRDNAIRSMFKNMEQAIDRIESGVALDYPAPRPYPQLARLRARWLHVGRYWIGFRPEPRGWAIVAVFFDAANIPARFKFDDI